MNYDPAKHHRRSIRLRGYDYSSKGAYFITLCAQNRVALFGEIINGKMELNDCGQMVARWWRELKNKFASIELDEFVIMPNHLHGIIHITGIVNNRISPNTKINVPEMIQWYKTMTTNEYIRNVKSSNWKPFDKRIWQRNYYEHIIRNCQELCTISQYIKNNPANWENDNHLVR